MRRFYAVVLADLLLFSPLVLAHERKTLIAPSQFAPGGALLGRQTASQPKSIDHRRRRPGANPHRPIRFADGKVQWYGYRVYRSAEVPVSKREMTPVIESFSKEALDEVFPQPSIREVAFEIRFAPRLRVNAELWKIQDEVVDQYPIVGSEQALQPNGAVLTVNVFQNPGTARAIKVSQENFVVAFTRYTRFEDFKEEVIARTKQFCSRFDIATIARAGLRYVNNIIVPATEKTSAILRYVRPVVDFERVNIDNVDQFVTEVRMRHKNHLATLRGALLGSLEDGRRIYVLDVDCHSRVQQTVEEIPALLDVYHESAQLFFLDHITEEYKNVMRGKS